MSDNKWHSGPPPSLGWWIASLFQDPECVRWWNGAAWSETTRRDAGAQRAGEIALETDHPMNQPQIEWKHRPDSWPARSRT